MRSLSCTTSYPILKIEEGCLDILEQGHFDWSLIITLDLLDLDNLFNIDNPYFEGMVNQIYPHELQLNKANTSDIGVPFLIYIYLFLTVLFPPKCMINTMTDFDILNFPFLDCDIPRRPSYGVYICQLIRFARECSNVDDFNTRDKCFLNRGFGNISLERLFPSSIADTMNFTRQKKKKRIQ